MMMKYYKVRIYPNKEQKEQINKHIGACRFIWNYMLELQINRYKNGEKYLSAYDMNYLLKPLKTQEEYKWLGEVAASSLCRTCSELDRAYQHFFKKHTKSPPGFRSKKKSNPIYPLGGYFYFNGKSIHVQKLGEIKYKSDYTFIKGREHVSDFHDSKILYEYGKYYVLFGLMCESQTHSLSDNKMGIDLGIKELAVVAYGDEQIIFPNINKSKKIKNIERRIVHTQRSISRKYNMSKKRTGIYQKTNNIEREKEKLRKLYNRQNNIRNNYLHQTTHQLISLFPCCVTMENLDVHKMMKNKYLSKLIRDQKFGEFIHQMKYKCERNGISFVQADRFYPSSKICSHCGSVKKDLKLSDRVYICDNCGLVIDRDYNAAINLMKYGTH